MIRVCTSRIGRGDRNLLSCILRSSACSDSDRSAPVLSGVGVERCGDSVRVAGTDGKILAATHCQAKGIELPQPVVVSSDGVRRACDLYLRMWRYDRRHAPHAVVTAKMATLRNRPALRIEVDDGEDGCTCPLVDGAFPNYMPCAERKAYRWGFAAGSYFNPAYLVVASRILGRHMAGPFSGGRGTFFKGERLEGGADDFVMVMPIALPDRDNEQWIFGRTDAAGAA